MKKYFVGFFIQQNSVAQDSANGLSLLVFISLLNAIKKNLGEFKDTKKNYIFTNS